MNGMLPCPGVYWEKKKTLCSSVWFMNIELKFLNPACLPAHKDIDHIDKT